MCDSLKKIRCHCKESKSQQEESSMWRSRRVVMLKRSERNQRLHPEALGWALTAGCSKEDPQNQEGHPNQQVRRARSSKRRECRVETWDDASWQQRTRWRWELTQMNEEEETRTWRERKAGNMVAATRRMGKKINRHGRRKSQQRSCSQN